MTVSVIKSNDTDDKLHPLQHYQMTHHQTEIECGHSMGNDKSHALPFALHHRGTVYLPWVYDFIYPSLWPAYAMIILII